MALTKMKMMAMLRPACVIGVAESAAAVLQAVSNVLQPAGTLRPAGEKRGAAGAHCRAAWVLACEWPERHPRRWSRTVGVHARQQDSNGAVKGDAESEAGGKGGGGGGEGREGTERPKDAKGSLPVECLAEAPTLQGDHHAKRGSQCGHEANENRDSEGAVANSETAEFAACRSLAFAAFIRPEVRKH